MVIDASVLVDIWVTSRPRHNIAQSLARYIKESRLLVTIPMHALLEVKCAIDNERKTPGQGDLRNNVFTQDDPLRVKYIAIDNAFIHDYLDLCVPYIKAGDLPYVLIAKKHNCPLITEDTKQYNVAQRAGVSAYTIAEYLEVLERGDTRHPLS
ncbi:MAG: PIN domain-containing protein [Phycisphaerae bacterium]|nr:PIN domain-containing protein [Phycisphaerae bacterium]